MQYLNFQLELIKMIVVYRSSIPVNLIFITDMDFETCRERLLSLRTPIERPTRFGYAQTKMVLEQLDNQDTGEISFKLAGGIDTYYGTWSGYMMTLTGHLHRQNDKGTQVTISDLVFARSFVSGFTLLFTLQFVFPFLGLLCCVIANFNILTWLVWSTGFALWIALSTALSAFNQRGMVKCKDQLIALVYEALTDTAPIVSQPPLYENEA